MKVTRQDGKAETRVLTAMVVDNTVATRIASKWKDGGLFRSRWANLVGGWCADYAKTYGKAPGAHIEDIFNGWAANANDDETVDLVDGFLGELSGAYEKEASGMNSQFFLDMAGEHFNAVLIERTAEQALAHTRRGDAGKAEELLGRWGRVDLGVGEAVDPFDDPDAIDQAFEDKADPIITYSGALGEFFGDQLGRDEFVAITGATGRGKTWWLLDIVWQAARQGRRVAFFSVGDMSRAQVLRRIAARATGHPLKPGKILLPNKFEVSGGHPDIETEETVYEAGLTAGAAKAALGKLARKRKGKMKISCHPNSSITIQGIDSKLDEWERDGWVPDAVVLDYADVLLDMPGFQAGDRNAINENWKRMRGISQKRHCLFVTATQADANSYNADLIRRSNFSDDRRKNDHVTAMMGLNASEEERALGVYRLNWMKRREETYSENRCVWVAGCLAVGRPHILSAFDD